MKSRVIAGRYKILHELGRGSGGITYLANDQANDDHKVALKCPLATDTSPEIIQTFHHECKLLQQLSHPHIAKLLQYGHDEAQSYYTTEYVEGDDFIKACQDRDWNAVFQLIVQLCWALDYLHSQQVTHRDLKPANILVGKVHATKSASSLERLHLKLIDFGLAINKTSKEKTEQTAGTLAYMAPEVLTGKTHDQRADLYSLGVVLYEMALGRLPTTQTKNFSRYLEDLHQHKIDLSPLNNTDEIPIGIISLIENLLQKNPAQRFQNAVEVIQHLNTSEHESFPLQANNIKTSSNKTETTPLQIPTSKPACVTLLKQLVRGGQLDKARQLINACRQHFKKTTDPELVETFYWFAGYTYIEQGDFNEAEDLIAELAEHPALAKHISIDQCILKIQLAYRQGYLQQAQHQIDQLDPHLLKQAKPEQLTRIETYSGLVAQGSKQYDAAAKHFATAADFAKQSGRQDHQTSLLSNAASLYYEQGEWARAFELYNETALLARQTQNQRLLANVQNNLGNLYLYFGRLQEAEQSLEESLQIAQEQQLASLEAYNLYLLATGELGKGNREKVQRYLNDAIDKSQNSGGSPELFQAQLAQAYLWLQEKNFVECEQLIPELRSLAQQTKQASYVLQIDWFEAKLRIQSKNITQYPIAEWLHAVKEDAEQRQFKNSLWQILYDEGAYAQLLENSESAQTAYQQALQVIDELKQQVPPQFQQSFLRDRKKTRIRAALKTLNPKPITEDTQETMNQIDVKQWSEINRRLLMQQDIDQLLEEILDATLSLTDAERGFVILSDQQELDIRTARNFDKETLNPEKEEFSYTIARNVMRTGKSMVSLNAAGDKRFTEAQSVHVLKINSVICVPLQLGKRTVGLIYLDNRYRPGVLRTQHIQMVESIADQASLALEHTRLHRENRAKIELIEKLNQQLERELNTTSLHLNALRESMKREHEDISLRYSYDNIIGKSPELKKVLSAVDRFSDTDSSVFIHGESGTGKELIAHALHYNSPRKHNPFIAENCAAVSESLLESELFGHVKGAFTGADHNKIGLFQMANHGTLFLDEIGDMSLNMQSKLLRILQEGEVRRVGGNEYHPINVRIVTASHKDLRQLVEQKLFRQDLYYRINVVRITLPPLRERGEDILLLADHFLEELAQAAHRNKPRFSKGALQALLDYSWPGNIRELQNEMKRLMVLGSDVISPSEFSPQLLEKVARQNQQLSDQGLEAILAPIEKQAILTALERSHGNKVKAAQLLKIGRRTLYVKLKEYGIDPDWGKEGPAKKASK